MAKYEYAMIMYVRPVDQGQIVEVSYGYSSDGYAYKRVHDRSDRTVQWYVGELDWDREPEGVDHSRVPCVHDWKKCEEPS